MKPSIYPVLILSLLEMRMLLALLILFPLLRSTLPTQVSRVQPLSGPTSGGTVLSVWGSGFIGGEEGTVCYWQGDDFGASSDATANINNTYLECTLPTFEGLANFRRISADRSYVILDFLVSYNQTLSTNKLSFTLFNLSILSVTALTPLEGLYTQPQSLTFSLSGLNYTQELACLFLQGVYPVTGLFLAAEYIVTCDIPSVPSPRREQAYLSLNGDTSGIIAASPGTSLAFTFYHSAPVAVVSYSPSLTRLHLDFDREVEVGGREEVTSQLSPSCDLIFSADTLGFIGTDAVCSWDNYQERRLVIELTRLSSLRGHTEIEYNSLQSFRTRHTPYSYVLEVSSISLDGSPPVPALLTPTHIPVCGDMAFSAVSSQMGGTQDLGASWGVSASDEQATTFSALLSRFGSQTGLEWSLPVTLFQSGVTYTVNLTLSNFLSNSVVTSVPLTESPADLPSVTIHYSIPGTHYTHRDLLILTLLEVPPCLPLAPSPLSFSWRLDNPVTSLSHSDLPVLLLPANSLFSPSEYQVTYTVSKGSNSLSSRFPLPLSQADPVALVLGGNRRTHSLGEDLVLDGSASFDHSRLPLSYRWTCYDINSTTACRDKDGNNLLAQDSSRLFVLQQSLLRESFLRFSLTVSTMDGRTSTATLLTVEIRSSVPGVVYLSSLPYSRVPVGPDIPTRVAGWVRSPSDQYLLSLTALSGVVEGQQYYDHSNNLDAIPLQFSSSRPYSLPSDSILLHTSQLSQFSFHIPSASLRAGQRYRLVASLNTQEGVTAASAEMDIRVDSPPHLGGLTSTSYVGSNGVKMYSLRASRWRDAPSALPLKYRFGIGQVGGGVHWLTPSTTLAQLETPLLCSVSAEIPLVLRIENSYGSTAYSSAQLLVSANDNVTGAMEEVRDKLVYGYSVVGGLSIASSILYFYETEGALVPAATAATLWEYINTTYWSLLSRDRSLSSHVIFLTAKFVLQTHSATGSQLMQVLDLLYDALAYVSECPPLDLPFERGLSPQLFNVTLAAIAKLNTSNLMAWYKLPSVLTRLAASIQNNLNPEVVSLQSGHISLKVSHSSLPERYYAACNAREQDCSGSLPLVRFSEAAFQSYKDWDCSDTNCSVGSSGFESVRCYGLIIVTSELSKQSYFLPSEYSPQLVSGILSIALLHPSTYEERSVAGVTVTLLTDHSDSPPAHYYCALWSAGSLSWDTTRCSTLSRDNSIVECQCDTSGTISVVSVCPPGSYGTQCSQLCPLGSWGDQCTQSCDCSPNSTCTPIDGFCDCFEGYVGPSCDTVCSNWTYGRYCSAECTCYNRNSKDCDPVHGLCDCKPGFRGESCAVTCNRGTWGYKCAGECQCQSTGLCDYFDGSCICQAGFGGMDCGDPCSEWTYGANCTGNCSCDRDATAACSPIDGVCECLTTHTGSNCSTVIVLTGNPLPIDMLAGVTVVIVIVFCIVIIILVILTVVCCRKIKRRAVAISPDKMPFYFGSDSDSLFKDRLSPVSNLRVHYKEFVSTKVDSLVAIPLAVSSDSMLGEDSWHFIEVVVVWDKDTWRPHSQKGHSDQAREMDTTFLAPEKPELGMLSLSGQFSQESKTDTILEMFSEPVLLPRADNTLINLREAFVDSGLWPGGPFQFLKKDIAYTFISLGSEEEYELSDLADTTIYIQQVRDVGEVMLELCVCGRVSNFECSLCGARGYCGEECQGRDWEAHIPICSIAQKSNDDHNVSLDATMGASMDCSFFEDSALPGELKLAMSSRLEKIGEEDPITHVRQKRSLPEHADQPLTQSDYFILEEHPGTDEVVYFDIHEGRRRRSPTEGDQGDTKVDT